MPAPKEKDTKMIKILLCLICITFCACAGKHCVAIGGTYDGVQGTMEYCFDAKATDSNDGVATLIGPDGKQNYLINEDEAKKLEAVLEQAQPVSAAAAGTSTIKRLLSHIQK